jgi:hypothetical protein
MVSKSKPQAQPRAERIKAALPALVDGKEGVTLDISASGVYIELPKSQEVGSRVDCVIDLSLNGNPMQVRLNAEVVRVERKSGGLGLALKIIDQTLMGLASAA